MNNQYIRNLTRQLHIQVHMHINFLFPSQSSYLGKKSGTTSTKPISDMKRKWPFIILIIPNRSSFRVLDYFKKVHIHLLQFKSRFINANIISELATWKIGVLIVILLSIVDNTIIIQTDVPNTRNLQEEVWKEDLLFIFHGWEEDAITS